MDLTAIRNEFPITGKYNFQNHAGVAPLSRRAAAAMQHYVEQLPRPRLHRRPVLQTCRYRARTRCQAHQRRPRRSHLHQVHDRGIAFVANGLEWQTGDNVVITSVEFPANVYRG